ncbi:MAG: NAD(P)H-dependent oxidoreductase [Hyphomonas sp.]|nr:NAD(P)H-dependent oxidoreductase [Hyphomonas sp.]
MKEKLKIALIYGSDRENRLCAVIGKWVQSELAEMPGLDVDVMDPLELKLPPRFMAEETTAVADFRRRISEADGFIVLTPEYNHSFPSTVKLILDTAYDEWGRKPVAFVSYGGMAGGIRAVEQLRQVVAELSMVSVRAGVALANPWNDINERGFSPSKPAADAVDTMVRDLGWWATALRVARQRDLSVN